MGQGASTRDPVPMTGTQPQGTRVRVSVKERYHGYLPKYINRHATLTEEKVRLVSNHWNFIAEDDSGMQDAGLAPSRISVFYDAFYEKLFEKIPEARNLFDGNMVRQSRALVKMVSWLCNLEVTDDLISRLEALADRHVDYGCLPMHYEAGGDALQHALRATAVHGQDPQESKVVMKAWKDLYSFVILVVIPRTALRLEESVRSAGTVAAMLRPTPMSGTRLKVLATPPRPPLPPGAGGGGGGGVWHHQLQHQHQQQQQRYSRGGGPSGVSPVASLSGVSMAGPATPDPGDEDDEEWFGSGRGAPTVRSRSGPFSRSSSVRRQRKRGVSRGWGGVSPHDGGGGSCSSGRGRAGSGERFGGILGAPWGGGGGAQQRQRRRQQQGHLSGERYGGAAGSQDGDDGQGDGSRVYTPGDSPSSMTSSTTSGHPQIGRFESVATTAGANSACASPAGSGLGTSGRGRGGRSDAGGSSSSGRKAKILRGLGKRGVGARGVGGSGSGLEVGGIVTGSSPRGSIGARARAVLGGRGRRQADDGAGGRPALSTHLGRRYHSRINSDGAPQPSAAAAPTGALPAGGAGDGSGAPGCLWSGAGGGGLGTGAPAATPFAAQTREGDPNTHHTQRRRSDRSGGSDRGGAPPPLASPASSALSLPGARSWEHSSAVLASSRGGTFGSSGGGSGGGGACVVGVSSKRQLARISVAPKSRTPTTGSLTPSDHGWNDTSSNGGSDLSRRDERTPRSRRAPAAGIREEGSSCSGGGGESGSDPGGSRRSLRRGGPRERPDRGGGDAGSLVTPSPRLPPSSSSSSSFGAAPPLPSPILPSYEESVGETGGAAPTAIAQQQQPLPVGSRARLQNGCARPNGNGSGGGSEGPAEGAGSSAGKRWDASPHDGLADQKRGARSGRVSPPRAPKLRAGARELQGCPVGVPGAEEPLEVLGRFAMPVTPDVAPISKAQRSAPSPAQSRNGSRRAARRADSGSRSSSSRRRKHQANEAEKQDHDSKTPQAGAGDDQTSVFDDDSGCDLGRGRNGKSTLAEAARGSSADKNVLRRPPSRKLSFEAATMFGFLDDNGDGGCPVGGGGGGDGGGDDTDGSKPEQRTHSLDKWSRSASGSDFGVVDSIGANAMAFFEQRLQKKGREDAGGRAGAGADGGGSDRGVRRRAQGSAASRVARRADPSRETVGGDKGKEEQAPAARVAPGGRQQQEETKPPRRQGRDAERRAVQKGKEREEEDEGEDVGSVVVSVVPALAVTSGTSGRNRLYADRQQSPTPEELAALQAKASACQVWQAMKASNNVPTPPWAGAAAASSPPHCPSPFLAARPATAGASGSGSDTSGGSCARTVGPSTAWCTTTRGKVAPVPANPPAPLAPDTSCPAAAAAAAAPGAVVHTSQKTLPLEQASAVPLKRSAGAGATAPEPVVQPVVARAPVYAGGDIGARAAEAAARGRGSSAREKRLLGSVQAAGDGAEGEGVAAATPVETRPLTAALPRAEEQQQQQKQQQKEGAPQAGLVKSDNTPMSLPPMDGNGHAPEADDFAEMFLARPRKPKGRRQRTGSAGPGEAEAEPAHDPAHRADRWSPAAAAAAASAAAYVGGDGGDRRRSCGRAASRTPRGEGKGVFERKDLHNDRGKAGDGIRGRQETAAPPQVRATVREGAPAGVVARAEASSAKRSGGAASRGGFARGAAARTAGLSGRIDATVDLAGEASGAIAGGTVSAASGRWGGRSAGAESRAVAEAERKEAAAAAAAAAAVAAEDRAMAVSEGDATPGPPENGIAAAAAATATGIAVADAEGARVGSQRATGMECGVDEAAKATPRAAFESGKSGSSSMGDTLVISSSSSCSGSISSDEVAGWRGATRTPAPTFKEETAAAAAAAAAAATVIAADAPSPAAVDSAAQSWAPPEPSATPGGSKSKGRVAAMAASFMAGNWGRGGEATAAPTRGPGPPAGGAGATHSGASGVIADAQAAETKSARRPAPPSTVTVTAQGDGRGGRRGRAGMGESAGVAKVGGRAGGPVRTNGPMEGLAFGNVRQKANAWGVVLRS